MQATLTTMDMLPVMIDNENLTIAWTLSYTDDDRTVDLETTSNQMFLIWD
ncbi:MAG: hypothetical protein WC429_07495 [Verrucomicrobiia bacterium]